MIPGGYYLKARCIQDSEIAHAAPVVREIWDYLIKEANHAPNDKLGLSRGSTVRRIADIQDALHWFVGYRKEVYSNDQCEKAMKWLAKAGMIEYTKTARGLRITVCKYDTYQDPKNYEDGEVTATKAGRRRQCSGTINKNDKNVKDSTPQSAPEWEFSNEGFFDRQLSKNSGEPEIDRYRALVEFLHSKDEEGNYLFASILALDKQISYKDYQILKKMQTPARSLKGVLEDMQNKKDTIKRYSSVFLTAKNWLKRDIAKQSA